ncbi:conserved Plasmodium protein, unknown function [Plasmodium relictum]|uniref:Uncharacterized protein n=1 Tax=Plasmodium relictum TaxID=85471 RepID=A0A1J1HB03_PLARL|nr:conserved Plasmodium protein, unknown function [Plasmodium relictum]CRH01775.1 conserved Plasmodium protein, unknown function [Plasmodium relictum]
MYNSCVIKIYNVWNHSKRNLLKKEFCSNNFEYSSPNVILKFKNTPIIARNTEKNKNSNSQNFPDSNDEFFELIKKSFKENKNNLSLWNSYCRETMYRINEKNIHPKIITNVFSFLSYTDYKNDRILSEILNRCILRLKEFDLIHICSLINSLSKMNFRNIYFLEEAKKKIISENNVYFEKHSPHYICLLMNSLIKLNFCDEEFLNFLLEKICNRKVEEYSLLGLSLLLYNISKLKFKKYYNFFSLFECHIIKQKNDFGVIQIVNILSAYNNVNLLKDFFLTQMLDCINKQLHFCSLHHLIRLLSISFSFVSEKEKNDLLPDSNIKKICEICSYIAKEIYIKLNKCKKKDIVLLCSTLSIHKGLVQNKNNPNFNFFQIMNVNEIFQKITLNIKKFINFYNSVEMSIILYCYSIYEINDILLFNYIKLRSLRIFSTFDEKTFSYLFKAFKNMNIKDIVFEKSCVNKILEIKEFNSIKNFCMTLSAFSKVKYEQKLEISDIFFINFRKFMLNSYDTKNHLFYLYNKEEELNNDFGNNQKKKKHSHSFLNTHINDFIFKEKDNTKEEAVKVMDKNVNSEEQNNEESNKSIEIIINRELNKNKEEKKIQKMNGNIISLSVFLFSKIKNFNPTNLIKLLVCQFENYKNDLSTENCINILLSISYLSMNMKNVENKQYWKSYYNYVNFLVRRILISSDLYKNKSFLINFLSACGKIFHSFITCIKKDEKKDFYFKNILDILIKHIYPYINELNIGEIGILMESLNKENYSYEATSLILKNDSNMFFSSLLQRCKLLLSEKSVNNKNSIIIMSNLIKIEFFDKCLFNLMIKNCVLQFFCLRSINFISQGIHYICSYILLKEHIIVTRKIFLLKFLLKKLHELLINEEIVLYSNNNKLIVLKESLDKLSNDILFIKSIKLLYESFLIILFHISDINFNIKKSEMIYYYNNNHNIIILLNNAFMLHLFLAIFTIAETLKKKCCNIDNEKYFHIIEQIHKNIKDIKIKSEYISLGFFKFLAINT